ncbi:glycosyltransferase family 8 protein [Cucurbitaria berberidis CBS 394.84]|uniref:Glycosyltransferase family 8 protein n=1 Tax=Cucurbitaria berberidis CBS 394.84 TaxID=1168544 RepID=A0A9P4GET2_9PLEO|nr:glycosyltransferase family 8 protein [Cucurbitaria berberidis CBS 394.84]KAF1843880.1 glycosyltransferase family 8 protein [Cucurbitaria berberidis CBS 394.84]
MRRKRSDELPRFVDEAEARSFRWRRKYTYYLCGFIFVCWLLYPSGKTSSQRDNGLNINWSHYAYSLYAIDGATLCHALLLFDALARFGSKADRVLFYPAYWDLTVESSKDRDSQLLVLARDQYKVKLQPIELLAVESRTGGTRKLDKTVTKFMAFSLAYYDRVISLDSDITLLDSLDELFLLPKTSIAMPRSYGTDSKPWPLTSMLMVIQPSLEEFERFKKRIGEGGDNMLVKAHRFDMEIVNERFEESALVLPHRPYALLTSEFRRHDHATYLGDPGETWDAEKVFKEAKLVHFSDWPLQPWVMWPQKGLQEMQPDCNGNHEAGCAERRIWKHLYDDFRHRRKDICKLLSVPAPEWTGAKGRPQNSTDRTDEQATPHATSTPSS